MGGSCRPPMAPVSGDLGCCWQQESGGRGLGPSRALEACPQELGCLPEAPPHRPFSPCPLVCTLGLAGSRAEVALKAPLPARGQGHREEAHLQLPWGCLCLCGVPGGHRGPLLALPGEAHHPARSVRSSQPSAAGSGLEVPGGGGRACSRGDRACGGMDPCGRHGDASAFSWLCEGSVALKPEGGAAAKVGTRPFRNNLLPDQRLI